MKVIEDKKSKDKGILSVTETNTNIKTTIVQKRVLESGDTEVRVQQCESNSYTKSYHLRIGIILLF